MEEPFPILVQVEVGRELAEKMIDLGAWEAIGPKCFR